MFKKFLTTITDAIKNIRGSEASQNAEASSETKYKRYAVGPDAISLEEARLEAIQLLEAGECFVVEPNDDPNDVPDILPDGLRFVFLRYLRIETFGGLCYIDLGIMGACESFPGYYYIGDDMESPLFFGRMKKIFASAVSISLMRTILVSSTGFLKLQKPPAEGHKGLS